MSPKPSINSAEVAIKVGNLSKVFKLPHEKNTSVKSAFVNFYKKRSYESQQALKDVSFEIEEGEFFGIVGRNGSGKSTLLKLIAEIYTPTKGSVTVNGHLTPFIELGVGFNPELTGRENVFLNGALLGFDRADMQTMYKDIVDFAELENFMDQKLKNYSSGMQVRLAFSIAIRAQSDILLIDEVLAVGDIDFQKKCYNYFYELKRQKKTIIFVSHDMSAIRRFCTKGILINNGKIIAEGDSEVIASEYEELSLQRAEERLNLEGGMITKKKRQGNQKVTIKSAGTFNPKTDESKNTFYANEKIGVRATFVCNEDVGTPAVGFIFQNESDQTVYAINNQILGIDTKALKKGMLLTMECVVDNVFTDGEYTITIAVESNDFMEVYDRIEYIHRFMTGGHKLAHALIHPPQEMKIKYQKS